MLGIVVLPLTLIFAAAPALPERLASAECETAMVQNPRDGSWNAAPWTELPCVPVACVPTFCETWVVDPWDGSLVCLDTDERFPAGHWSLDIGPDQGEIQATVEY